MTVRAAALSSGASEGMSPLRVLLRDALLHPQTRAYVATMRVTLGLILLSISLLVAETAHDFYRPWQTVFDTLETLVLIAFTVEYVAHIYAVDERRKYIFSIWGLIDLLAILPSYLAFFHIEGLTFLRELRVLRVLRMLKLMKLAADRSHEAAEQAHERKITFGLDIQIYLIFFFTVVVIASTLAYHAERAVPDTKFTSIPAAMWWAVVTVTTTGYGDLIPDTIFGRFVAAGTMLAGLALFSLLTSVVGRVLMTSLFGSTPEDESGGSSSKRRRDTSTAAYGHPSTLPAGGDAESLEEQRSATIVPDTLTSMRVLRDQTVAMARTAVEGASVSEVVGGDTIRRDAPPLKRLLHSALIDHSSPLYKKVSAVLTTLIFASVAIVVLESLESVYAQYENLFQWLESAIVAAFTLEYLAYIYLAERKSKYILSFWGLVDLLAVLPTYIGLLAFLLPINITAVKVVRMMRVLRMLRTLKLTKSAVDKAQHSLQGKGSTFALDLQIYFIALFTAVVISSTLVYYLEHEQPDTTFTSIPAAMWWGIVTITTTGYGDMIPATFGGRVLAGGTMLVGLALFGILTSVIGRAMMSSLFGSTDDEQTPPDGDGAAVELTAASAKVPLSVERG